MLLPLLKKLIWPYVEGYRVKKYKKYLLEDLKKDVWTLKADIQTISKR